MKASLRHPKRLRRLKPKTNRSRGWCDWRSDLREHDRERRLVESLKKTWASEPMPVYRTREEALAASKARLRPCPTVTQPAPGVRCGGSAPMSLLLPLVAFLLWIAYLISKS